MLFAKAVLGVLCGLGGTMCFGGFYVFWGVLCVLGGSMCFGGFYVFWGFYVVVSQLIELKFCMFTCNNPAEGDAGIF